MARIVVVAAKRTPQGRFLGSLAKHSAADLGVAAAEAVLSGIDRKLVDLVVVGNILSPIASVARQIGLRAGVRQEAPAFTVNMACASGLQAASLAADAIRLGRATVALVGGAESMSNAPYLLDRARSGYKFGDGTLIDGMQLVLSDPVSKEGMAMTAERLAEVDKISRQDQDAFALASQRKAVAARDSGTLADEIVALPELAIDEHPRADTSLEKLGTLKPAFKKDGTITAGNASGINDGAAMAILCDEDTAKKHGWRVLAEFVSAAIAGVDPAIMGVGPVSATRVLCDQQRLTLDAFDTIELNEAFAAQALSVTRRMGLKDDDTRVNPDGGAIALGHPVGASGARLLVHLAHRAARGKTKLGLATLCAAGGMGIAAAIRA